MSLEDRIEKAKELAKLTGVGKRFEIGKDSNSGNPSDFRGILEEKSLKIHIELRAKHMTEKQLDAFLEFYKSEMGASILVAQEAIQNEFRATFIEKINASSNLVNEASMNPNKQKDSGARIVRGPDNSYWNSNHHLKQKKSARTPSTPLVSNSPKIDGESNNHIKPPLLNCSFCGKSNDEVKKLVAGPSVFICNECTDLAASICLESRNE